MVNYIPAYEAFCQTVRQSEDYRGLDSRTKEEMEKALKSEEIRNYFKGKFVPQLTLHESLVLAFANSDALQKRNYLEIDKVMDYLQSKGFSESVDNLERKLGTLPQGL